ncbi:MAG: hypothetical protein GXY27_03385 [Erysipelotrichaceae bacterium]|jgi:hypothetical protein|nr:hypothetical protein [Erysipelotrichaceae bacterium]
MEENKRRKRQRQRYYGGEDIEMFKERERNSKRDSDKNICDDHIDGA